MNEDSHGHKFSLGLMTIDGKLPREGILIDVWFLFVHYKRFINIDFIAKVAHLNVKIIKKYDQNLI